MLALWTRRYGYIFGTPQRTTYWNFVPTSEVFALAVCNFWKHNYFDWFSNSWCKHFEQHTTNLSLEHFKEQHTGIWCLLVKYLLWQCAMWTTFGKHNYFGQPIFEQLVQPLWTERYESFCGSFQRTTYRNLVSTGEFGSVLFGQIFVTTIFFGRFLNSSCKPFAQGAMDLFMEYPKD